MRKKKLLCADPIVNRKLTVGSAGQGFHSQLLRFFITSLQSNIALEIILTPFSAETHKQDEKNPCFCLQREELRTSLKHSELLTAVDSTRVLNSHLKHRFSQERPIKHPKMIKLTALKKGNKTATSQIYCKCRILPAEILSQ